MGEDIFEDVWKLTELLKRESYRPERALVGPEFQVVVDGWAIEDACVGIKTWLSLTDRTGL